MNSFAAIVLEIPTALQNIYFEEYLAVAASESCQEIHLKEITKE